MFRYLNIFIILVIAYHREILYVIESPSNLLRKTILQMSGPSAAVRFSMAIPSEEILSDDEFKCELT